MNNPEYVKIDEELYQINTDFRVALECNKIAMDNEIDETEKSYAIVYKLFGDKGLYAEGRVYHLLQLGLKYLSCGQELEYDPTVEPDMDFEQDMDLIEASFMSDYGIDLENTKMHWWKFYKLLNGLSNSEMGNCCVLNRVRNLRNLDLNTIEDPKTKRELQKAKELVALKKKEVKQDLTIEQEENIRKFYEELGIERKE